MGIVRVERVVYIEAKLWVIPKCRFVCGLSTYACKHVAYGLEGNCNTIVVVVI